MSRAWDPIKWDVSVHSRIIIDTNGRSMNVTFFEKHIGLECENVRTRIPKDERAKIADMMCCYNLLFFICFFNNKRIIHM